MAAGPTIRSLTLSVQNTEYSAQLPDGTKHFSIQAVENTDVRIARVAGIVKDSVRQDGFVSSTHESDGDSDTYWTLKKNWVASSVEEMWGSATITLYFAFTGSNPVTLEFWIWR